MAKKPVKKAAKKATKKNPSKYEEKFTFPELEGLDFNDALKLVLGKQKPKK